MEFKNKKAIDHTRQASPLRHNDRDRDYRLRDMWKHGCLVEDFWKSLKLTNLLVLGYRGGTLGSIPLDSKDLTFCSIHDLDCCSIIALQVDWVEIYPEKLCKIT